MAIATLSDYAAATRYRALLTKTNGTGFAYTIGAITLWTASGTPAAATAAISSTASGQVPTKATTGAIQFPDFSGVGYITSIEASAQSDGGRILLFDRLFACGSYSGSAGTTTLSSPPSYSSRLPGGSSAGLMLAYEQGAGAGGNASSTMSCTYTNESGTTGRTSGSINFNPSGYSPRFSFIALANGDKGVQAIESVSVTGSNAGTHNLIVLRPLWYGRVKANGAPIIFPLETVGAPIIYSDSCLMAAIYTDNNIARMIDLSIEIASA